MLNVQDIGIETFLKDYWQKKPLVIRNALPDFTQPLTPDELAGLALEQEIESRIVIETPNQTPQWHLKRGPFLAKDFKNLPKTHWTLLVQGVDRFIPEVYALLNHFDFIPQWRIDDVMISYAALYGSVGPHYDNYDVFLYQAKGKREWSLTCQECTPDNYISELELRIMRQFAVEETYLLEEGDLLYLPPHVGHYGIAQSPDCMTYSFGYRAYQRQEMLESLSDYLSENKLGHNLYQDPDWSKIKNPAELTPPAWQQAQKLLLSVIQDDTLIRSWFGCFATTLDQQAEQLLPHPLEDDELLNVEDFIEELRQGNGLERDPCCRLAYETEDTCSECILFINGNHWDTQGVSQGLIKLIANNRILNAQQIDEYLDDAVNQLFLYELWKLQWLTNL